MPMKARSFRKDRSAEIRAAILHVKSRFPDLHVDSNGFKRALSKKLGER